MQSKRFLGIVVTEIWSTSEAKTYESYQKIEIVKKISVGNCEQG
jgi:hypothetical protein